MARLLHQLNYFCKRIDHWCLSFHQCCITMDYYSSSQYLHLWHLSTTYQAPVPIRGSSLKTKTNRSIQQDATGWVHIPARSMFAEYLVYGYYDIVIPAQIPGSVVVVVELYDQARRPLRTRRRRWYSSPMVSLSSPTMQKGSYHTNEGWSQTVIQPTVEAFIGAKCNCTRKSLLTRRRRRWMLSSSTKGMVIWFNARMSTTSWHLVPHDTDLILGCKHDPWFGLLLACGLAAGKVWLSVATLC